MADERKKHIKFIEQRLRRFGSPRLHVSLILSLTTISGFLSSFILLKLGLTWMAIRYPLAILIAYGIFLLLLRMWLWFHGRSIESPDIDIATDFGGISLPDGGSGATKAFEFGGGGDFAGAGAGSDWGSPVTLSSAGGSGASSSGGSSIFDGISLDIDLDEGIWLVLALVALLGGIIAIGWVIYFAPGLFAEIFFDGVLAAGLYRRAKRIERRHWLWSALRQTAVPAAIVIVFSGVIGFALNEVVPEAHSIGDVMRHLIS